jgi:hypothetical protein
MIVEFQKDPLELWRRKKAKLMLRFQQLHDEDFFYDYGKKDGMITKLHLKLGVSRDDLALILSKL